MFAPASTAAWIATPDGGRLVRSTITTASAPAGSIAPVEIAIAWPSPTASAAGWPARDSPTSSSSTGRSSVAPAVSAARTA